MQAASSSAHCDRRQFGRREFLSLLGLGLARQAQARKAEGKWNFVLILADDMGWTDLGCYGSQFYRTPNIDRLAAEGMRFTDAYAAAPVCSPTRAAILTGQYPARLRVTDWIPGLEPPGMMLRQPEWVRHLPHEATTIPELLRPAGYLSASIGKWHLGGEGSYPEQHGFDRNIAGTNAAQPKTYFAPYGIPTLKEGPAGEYLTDRLAEEAVGWLSEVGSRPFFLYMSHFAVHMPIQGKQHLVKEYEGRIRPGLSHSHPVYAAMIESLDQAVGRLLATLEQLKVADRTVVIFTSDNGGVIKPQHITSMEPLRGEKGTLYEGGIRVPLIIRWPGVSAPGSLSRVPVSSIDLLPTIADIAGLPLPQGGVDGQSLVPLLKGGRSLEREALYWHYPHYNLHQALTPMTPSGAIRKGEWKLIERYEDGRLELYNLREDIGERFNLAASRPEKARELQQELEAWRKAVNAQMPTRVPENYDPRKTEEWLRSRGLR